MRTHCCHGSTRLLLSSILFLALTTPVVAQESGAQCILQKTHRAISPWWIVRSDDKHAARRETLKLILKLNPYRGRSRSLDFEPDPNVVIPGDLELMNMKAERKKHGRFLG